MIERNDRELGVKYNREYKDIINELSKVIQNIDNFYEFIMIETADWINLNKVEQDEIVNTIADDIFFALGSENIVKLGNGLIKYNAEMNVVEVYKQDKHIEAIKLI